MQIKVFGIEHSAEVVALCSELGWDSYAHPTSVERGFCAPGVYAFVAVEQQRVVGFVHAFGDGIAQGYLSMVGVADQYRGRGIATQLIRAATSAAGVPRMDLLADEGAEGFYRAFPHRQKPGYRIYPGS